MPSRSPTTRALRGLPILAALFLVLVLALLPGAPGGPRDHACRFWALIGTDYPDRLLTEHLQEGTIANLRDLGGANRDGWGLGCFLSSELSLPLNRPIVRRGGPPADHPTDPDFDLAVEELERLRPRAVIGHVRAGTSGHWGIPNPHPFQHEGILFAHNGGVPVELLLEWLTAGDPDYLEIHPPDYVDGYIDSELYFLYLLKSVHDEPELRPVEAIRRAVRRLGAAAEGRLNFVATAGDTLLALRFAPYDGADPVRFYPELQGSNRSPYWVVASQVVGSDDLGWGTIPPRTLAIFVPGQPPEFLPVEPKAGPSESAPARVGKAQPNPLRDAVEIPIEELKEGAEVRLEIWDVQGRLVWQEERSHAAGPSGSLRWEGRDRNGVLAPSGTYYCRITAGGRSWTQTISVVR